MIIIVNWKAGGCTVFFGRKLKKRETFGTNITGTRECEQKKKEWFTQNLQSDEYNQRMVADYTERNERAA